MGGGIGVYAKNVENCERRIENREPIMKDFVGVEEKILFMFIKRKHLEQKGQVLKYENKL